MVIVSVIYQLLTGTFLASDQPLLMGCEFRCADGLSADMN